MPMTLASPLLYISGSYYFLTCWLACVVRAEEARDCMLKEGHIWILEFSSVDWTHTPRPHTSRIKRFFPSFNVLPEGDPSFDLIPYSGASLLIYVFLVVFCEIVQGRNGKKVFQVRRKVPTWCWVEVELTRCGSYARFRLTLQKDQLQVLRGFVFYFTSFSVHVPEGL